MGRRRTAATLKSTQHGQVTASLLCHAGDAGRAGELASMLAAAGVTVVGGAEADGTVVFLSAEGLSQPGWLDEPISSVRLIPVRVGAIRPELVPERLRELNWIDWQPDNVRATFGYVMAGLLSDPGRRDLSRQLSHEAEAWARSGCGDALLISDYRRARQMLGVLQDLDADRLAAPSDMMRQFVQRSVRVSRPRYRRRRWRMITGVVLTVMALVAVAVAVPVIRLGAYNNNESIVTSGDRYMLADLPEWSAANAAALLVDGTPAEQALAQITLARALDRPWEIDALQWEQPPASAVPFRHGTDAVVAVGTGATSVVMVIDVATQQLQWSMVVPGGSYSLSVSPDGGTALGVGPAGGIVISLVTHAWRRVATGIRFEDGELGSDGMAVVRLAGMRLAELNVATGMVTGFGAYRSLLSMAARTPSGPAAALVQTRAGQIELIDLPSRQVIAATMGNPSFEVGAIAPDHRHAVIDGGDGQFWTFGAGQPAMPTSITVPAAPSGLLWSIGHRLLVYSEDQRGQVYYLPRAEPLGTICREDTRLWDVVPDYGSDTVTCEGRGETSFWRLPVGPLSGRRAGESTARSATDFGVTVSSRKDQLRIRRQDMGTAWYQPLASDISAIDIAQGGTRVLVGDSLGEVGVIDLGADYASLVTVWVAPDHSPITAVGWDHGPVATTRSGQTWQVTDCGDCATAPGLISTYRSRFTGCFTMRQLKFISGRVWPALGIRECPAAIAGDPSLGRS